MDQGQLLGWISSVCGAGAVLGCLYMLTAAVATLRFVRHREVNSRPSAPVSVLKPLHGAEPRLFGRLSSFCIQNYDAPIELVFGTHDPADPAVDVVKRLVVAFPEKRIVLKVDTREHGANRKVSNLANLATLAQHDVLVVADSDIQVGPGYLNEVVSELQRSGVGAVTCLYHGVAGAGLWSRLSALAINTHFLPQVVMALSFGLAQPCFGATIALRRHVLTMIGGFAAFSNFLADDYAMGEAVRALGSEVVIAPRSVGHLCFESDLKSLLERQVRFARTIKSIDPVGYAGSVITHPLPLALIGATLGNSSCVLLAVLALACRLSLCLAIERSFRLDWQRYWLLPLQDLLSFWVYVVSFMGATVTWRDHRYRVSNDGRLVQVEE